MLDFASALKLLVDCGQAVQDGNLENVNSLLEQIWNLAEAGSDEDQERILKYFGEALVRRAYGLHPPTDVYVNCSLWCSYDYFAWYSDYYHRVDDLIKKYGVMGKNRLHLIYYNIPGVYTWPQYLLEKLGNPSGDPLSVRVSLILPSCAEKFNENVVILEKFKQDWINKLRMQVGLELEGFKVFYANSLEDVHDASTLDFSFRKAEDEAVVVCYNFMAQSLLGADETGGANAMERELLKLGQIKPELVVLLEREAKLNHSNFITRLNDSFQYYFSLYPYCYITDQKIYRQEIGNIVGCEGRDRIVRHQYFDDWQSVFQNFGFFPVPQADETDFHFVPKHREKNEYVSFDRNGKISISAWKLRETEHFNLINNNFAQGFDTPPQDTVQPLQHFPQDSLLNRLAAVAEIFDMLEELCSKNELQLALTWVCRANANSNIFTSVPYKKRLLLLERNACYLNKCENLGAVYLVNACKTIVEEEQCIAGKALQSSKDFHFEPTIKKLKKLNKAAKYLDNQAVVAICLQNCYSSDVIYVVELFLGANKSRSEAMDLASRIFNDLKNRKKMFVTLRINGGQSIEVGSLQEEPLQETIAMREENHAMGTQRLDMQCEAITNSHPHPVSINASSPARMYESNLMSYNGEVEIARPGEPRKVLSSPENSTATGSSSLFIHASSLHGISPFNAPNPMPYGGEPETQGPSKQENGKHTSFEPNVNKENEIVNDLPISSAKRRKLKSDVWEEFNKDVVEGKEWATCKHCDRKFDGSSKKGTTHLRNHLTKCRSRIAGVKDDQQPIFSARKDDSINKMVADGNPLFDQDRSSRDFARMIIMQQCPLNMVECKFFSTFVKNLQPKFQLQSQEALSSDIYQVYEEEKGRLLEYFDLLACRFNLTISLWAHDREKNIICCCYTVQFIDNNWKLKKKILALKFCGRDEFIEKFKSLLRDWNIEKKVCSLTIHDSSTNLDIAEEIRKFWLSFDSSQSSSTFCIISDECIRGVLGENVGKSMDGAIKTASACFADITGVYDRKLRSQQEGKCYSLINVKSDDINRKTCSMILVIAALLDPRFKLDFLEFWCNEIFGDDVAKIHLEEIRIALSSIFKEYAHKMYNGAPLNAEENIMESFRRWKKSKRGLKIEALGKSELDKCLKEELDKYIAEEEVDEEQSQQEFDVLGWWSENAKSFPILGRMARDILAIPMSSILSGSIFNEKVLMNMNNPIFSSLDSNDLIEAMICSKDWLESPMKISNAANKRLGNKACPTIMELKDNSALAGDLETITWTDKDIRAYLISPFTDKELKFLSEWSRGNIRQGNIYIADAVLAPLLKIPQCDNNLENPKDYYIEDRVVEQFFKLLKKRHERFPDKYMKHHSFEPFYATFLIRKTKTESEVLSWVKLENLEAVRKLFFPMCLNEHWLLFYVNIDRKELLWLDSMEHSRKSYVSEKQVILKWFLEFLLPSMGYDHEGWTFHVPENIPLQKNYVDCALFVMKYADCLTHSNLNIDRLTDALFTQDDMLHFRRRTFLDIYFNSIHVPGEDMLINC